LKKPAKNSVLSLYPNPSAKNAMLFAIKESSMAELQGRFEQGELQHKLEQVVQSNHTGRVMLRSGQRLGTLYICKHKITDAVVGTKKGLEALEVLQSWTDGEYRFSPGMLSQAPSLDLDLAALDFDATHQSISAIPTLGESHTNDPWAQSTPNSMVGNLGNVDIVNLLRVLCNVGQSGLLRLRPKDEARIYVEGGTISHAAYRNLRGLEALNEIATWTNDAFGFEQGLTSPDSNIVLPLTQILSKMGEVIEAKTTGNQSGGVMYFYSLPIPQGFQPTALGLEIIKRADGTSFEELVQLNNTSTDAVARELKSLLDQNLVRTEFSPSTPKALRGIKPQHLESKSFFALKPKLKLEQLSPLELSVYDQIDGGRTLWDIRINLGISRQEVWNAFQRLLEGGLAAGKPA
jgi:hypothetical protein